MKQIAPENRYLLAFNEMGGRAQEIYLQFGDLMEAMPPNRNQLAKKLGASVNTVGEVISFVKVWGGPGNGGIKAMLSGTTNPAMHYIIPDAHFSRKDRIDGFSRAKRLGRHMARFYALARRKNRIIRFICLGDWWDMISLCRYEKDKASFVYQSVSDDVKTGEMALAVMMDAFYSELERLGIEFDRRHASFIFTNGNHEKRLDDALGHAEHGVMLRDGAVPHFRDICRDAGWDFYEYQMPVNVDGVAYAHCLPSGVMGRAFGGDNACKNMLDKKLNSCVVGHSHLWDIKTRTDVFGVKKFALAAGCYYDRIPDYAKTTGDLWWMGVTVLMGVKDGGLTHGVRQETIADMDDLLGGEA